MLKIIGAVLVTVATTSVGLMSAGYLKNRARTLSTLVFGLEIMRAEICTRLTPIPELLELLARQTGEPANIFFADCLIKLRAMRGRPFSEVWKAALKGSGALVLNDAELEILTELGSALGRYDVERQGEAISGAKKRLEAQLAKAESERDKESRTRTFLGIAAGIAIAIILI